MSKRKHAAKRGRPGAPRRPPAPRALRRADLLSLGASGALAARRFVVLGALAAVSQPTLAAGPRGDSRAATRAHAAVVVDRSSYLADPGYLWDPERLWSADVYDPDPVMVAAVATEPEPAATRKSTPPGLRFDIAPGRLGTVLDAFSELTGVSVELSDPSLAESESPGVVGTYRPAEALELLLEGTGARHRFLEDKKARVEPRVVMREEIDVVDSARVLSPRHTEPLLDTPQSISIVDAELIQAQGATSLRDVLRNVTGISIQAGEGGGGLPGDNLAIRGFAARNDIFVDGVRDFGAYSRDPYNVQQVEVSKGPASVFGGRGSTGGAVNLVTKQPGLTRGLMATISAGTDDFQRTTVDLNRPFGPSEKSGGALRLNLMYTQGSTPGRDSVDNQRYGVAPSLALGLDGKTRFWLSGSYQSEDNRPDYGIPWVPPTNVPLAAYADQPAPVDYDNFYGLDDRDFEDTATTLATASVEHDLAPWATLRGLVRGGRSDRDSVITAPRFASNDSTDLNRQLQARDLVDEILDGQLELDLHLGTGSIEHSVVTGVEASSETAENRARSGPVAPLADLFAPDPGAPYAGPIVYTGARTSSDASTTAAYAFDTMRLSERVELMGGLRYDSLDVDFDSRAVDGVVTPFHRVDDMLSWRSGVVYKPRPQGSVYAAYGTSFNPSAEGNIGLTLTAATEPLEPEKSRTAEVGTKWETLGRHVLATAAVFQTEKTNARTPGIDPGDPPTVLEGRQRVRGFEVGVNGRFSEHWLAYASYTYLESEVLESNTPAEVGKELANTPENSWSFWASYRFDNGLDLGGGGQFVDDRWNNPTNVRSAPEYWRFDAAASYPVSPLLSLRLNLYNLADERYIDRVGGGHFIPGAGRSLALSAGLDF
jgi:catecholate siderophore receptor